MLSANCGDMQQSEPYSKQISSHWPRGGIGSAIGIVARGFGWSNGTAVEVAETAGAKSHVRAKYGLANTANAGGPSEDAKRNGVYGTHRDRVVRRSKAA
jgi:hypothetical protein